jgi:spermidine synthase
MDALQPGWFNELNDLWPGQCMSLKVVKVLHEEKSKYQVIKVLETYVFIYEYY